MTVAPPPAIEIDDIDADDRPDETVHELDTVSTAPPLVLVVFGASGDLAARKLLPAIAALTDHNVLPKGFTVVGVARTAWSDEEFRKVALKATSPARPGRKWSVGSATSRVSTDPDTFDALKKILDEADATLGTAGNRDLLSGHHPRPLRHGRHRARGNTAAPPPESRTPSSASWWRSPSGRDLASAIGSTRPAAHRLRRGPDLPDRPLHGQGDGPERPRPAFRQRHLRADLEPPLRRAGIQVTVAESLGVEHRGSFYETPGHCATSSRTT
jgi:glucose-6-phosphate 1-dehydrogenase